MPFFVNRSGEKLWFEEAGTGTALLLVHGWCMSSAVWHYQFRDLQSSFRVVAPDLRGHGYSRDVSGRLDFECFAADLADLISFLDLRRVVLVGWSMGAQIALQAYREISDRLAALVLVSATPCFTAKTDFPYGLTWHESAGMKKKVGRNSNRAVEGFHVRMFMEGELSYLPLADKIRALLAEIEPPDAVATLAALESLASADMRNLLPQINIPTLIMNGDGDNICLPTASSFLAENIQSAQHKVFPHSGHAPFLTRHCEFNAEIIRFVERVCG
jgi:pimeloyl-[acyl-carrier protein] methyl ester esterase